MFLKWVLMLINVLLIANVLGCQHTKQSDEFIIEAETNSLFENDDEAKEINEICLEVYQKASVENNGYDLEVVKNIVNLFGKKGYSAIDSENQINMTQTESILQLCSSVTNKKEDQISIFVINYEGGITEYQLKTKEGVVDVVRNYFKYENGKIEKVFSGKYKAQNWKYTKEGYLMFSGIFYAEELHALMLSDQEEYVALRVQPLDESLRELNRKYILPITYEKNNMFLTEWSEEDFGELNFYDVYDILYKKVNGQDIPYVADDNLGVGAIYEIPKDEFEHVIKEYFHISSEILETKTNYNHNDKTYEYRPRGFFDRENMKYPYPEVVSYSKNSDGTLKLMVNVVFPYMADSKVYTHEVVVRNLTNGKFQYVSNSLLSYDENCASVWHTPRLNKEQWEEIYTQNS